MEKDWVRIYKSSDGFKAETVMHFLHDQAIEVVKLNKKDSSYLFGYIELYIHPDDFEKAIEIIVNNEIDE